LQESTNIPSAKPSSTSFRSPFPFLLAAFAVVTAILCRDADLDGRRIALSLDPTLATTPVEMLWGFLSFPCVALSSWLGMSPWWTGLGLAATVAIAGLGLALSAVRQEGESVSWTAVRFLAFALFSWALGRLAGMEPLLSGSDALAFFLLGLVYCLGLKTRWDPKTHLVLVAVMGVLAGCGSLYVFCLAPLLQKCLLPRIPSPSPFYGEGGQVPPLHNVERGLAGEVGFTFPLLAFALLRTRYPNPLVPGSSSVWRELAETWLYGQAVLKAETGRMAASLLFQFAGMALVLVWIASFLFSRFCRLIWNTSAGRTVPVQLALFSLPAGGMAILALVASLGTKQPDTEANLCNIRTLTRMLPSRTVLFAPRIPFGAAAYLQTVEGGRPDLFLRLGTRERWLEERQAIDHGEPLASGSACAFSKGTNWVEIAGERIDFAPYYLLDASTEVYCATPAFFIGNDPSSATGGPVLLHGAEILGASLMKRMALRDRSYDGNHFFLFRERKQVPWNLPRGNWRAFYFGFILQKDLETRGNRNPPPLPVPIRDFYR